MGVFDKMKKIILILMLSICLISFVSSATTLGAFKQGRVGECIELVQTCGSCTYNNISTVARTGEDPIIYTINAQMTRDNTYYNYSFCNITEIGTYNVHGFGDLDGEKTSWVYYFTITPTGTILKTSDSLTYIILTIGSLFFFLLTLWGGMVLPFRNQRNDEGRIISVQKLKYFKVGLLFLSYVFFVWMLNLLLALSTNFSILTQYTKFFEVVFSVVNAMSYPIFVLMLIVMSIMAWKDLALKKLLLKGINPS